MNLISRITSGLFAATFVASLALAQCQGISKTEIGIGTIQDLSGPIAARHLACGASTSSSSSRYATPWKRIRCRRGRGNERGEALHEFERRHDIVPFTGTM